MHEASILPNTWEDSFFKNNNQPNEGAVLVTQSCPTLCNPMDCSPPGSSVHGIFQAGILSGLSFPSPGDLPNSGVEPRSPELHADSLLTEPPGKLQNHTNKCGAMSHCGFNFHFSND